MARSPFQGTYAPNAQPTVVTAPDGLVFINGETDLLGCPTCSRKFDLNKYVTALQVTLSVESVPGSASITLSIPRHTVDDFYVDGRTIVSPMMEVEIFAKGHFLVEGIPQYYPIFWGLVTEVSTDYSGGVHTVSINCADILKWWELCRMNINAAFTQPAGQLGRSIMGNVLYGSNPYDVIWLLAQQSFGDVVVATGSLTSMIAENDQKETFNAALGSIMQYWNKRFSRIRSNLMLYGVQGQAVRGDSLQAQYGGKGGPVASTAVRQANGDADGSPVLFDPTGADVVAFKTQFMEAGQVNFWQSEYQTKLEIAQAAKDALGYEFYMDVTGDIVFKPPFYNLDVLSNKPLSWIQDIDIISMNLGESEAEVVTMLQIQGNFKGPVDYGLGEETTPFTSVTDYHLLRKYGWRQQSFNSEFLASPHHMFYMGMDLLDRYNARRHRASVTIPIRPELRLGFPIYLAPLDQIWYVSGIDHNLSFGGQATTTLTLTARREKFIAPKGLGKLTTGPLNAAGVSTNPAGQMTTKTPTARTLQRTVGFELDAGDAAQMPPVKDSGPDSPYAPLILRNPANGRVMGYPNVVMAYTRPFADVSDKDLKHASGQKEKDKKPITKEQVERQRKALQSQFDDTMRSNATYQKMDDTQEKHLTNRYSYGLNSAGVYVYAHEPAGLIQEMILYPRSRLKVKNAPKDMLGSGKGSAFIRPVSDVRGFEVIGHSRYGRGISLRDGALVLSEGGANHAARIDMQLAVSGDVWTELTSQSVGVSVPTGQALNPADAVNRLGPTDLDTSAVISPETKKLAPVVGTMVNLVDAAPLGASFEREGAYLSVEAGQLSKALTLNEMGAKWGQVPGVARCGCNSGRGDLWFITQGLQVKEGSKRNSPGGPTDELLATHPDIDTRTKVRKIQDDVAGQLLQEFEAWPELEEKIQERMAALTKAKDPAAKDPSPKVLWEKAKQDLALEWAQNPDTAARRTVLTQRALDESGVKLPEATQEALLAGTNPPEGDSLLDPTDNTLDTVAQVESYLSQLYSALDAPHQEFEKILRGEYLQVPERDPIEVRFGTEAPSGPLSPPFSPVSRALGGDPAALAITGNTAVKNAAAAWNNFGKRLQNKTERAKLQSEVDTWSKDVERLTKERDRLQKGTSPDGNTTVTAPKGVDRNIQDLNHQIQTLQKQIAANQQKLSEV